MFKRGLCLILVLLLCVFDSFPENTSPASDFEYQLSTNAEGVVITGYVGKGGNVIIPSEIEGFPVLLLAEGVFGSLDDENWADNNITSIIIPDSVIVIGENVFRRNDTLKKVVLPNSLKIIPKSKAKKAK